MNRTLNVWWESAQVGTLIMDQNGDLGFAYADGWLSDESRPAISVSLPKRPEPFGRREARPFFAGLLPEEGQRETVARALGVSKANDFRLLDALGGDVAGALTLLPENMSAPQGVDFPPPEPFDDDQIVELLDALPRRPFLAGERGLRLSLAGAQQKLPIVLANGRIALPAPGQPTTHILKPPIPAFPGTTENEALVMKLAAAVGLPTAPVEPRQTHGRPYLLIARYDRALDPSGGVQRLHQEDFCQALGVPPERKYASEGGPNFAACFDLARRACTQPAVAVLRLLDAAIFNLIVGNADAHGKNFSLLYTSAGIELAPLYDLLCTAAYPEISPKMAMKIGRRATLGAFRPETWDAFAREIGMAAPFVKRRVTALAKAVLEKTPAVAATITAASRPSAMAGLVEVIQHRAEAVLAQADGHADI